MSLRRLASSPGFTPLVAGHSFILGQLSWRYRPHCLRPTAHGYVTDQSKSQDPAHFSPSFESPHKSGSVTSSAQSMPDGWEDNPNFSIKTFAELPHRYFGTNQHIRVNEDFKEALRQILWQFKAPIRYAFAYGSGVFSQSGPSSDTEALSPHPNPPEAIKKWQAGGAEIIDFIFGVSYTQHWHSVNIQQHPEHYSALRFLGSYAVSKIQDSWGAGVYFNPYITVNGTMIKYGVVNLDTICRDLSEWDTLYLAGRLQKPVKILRDDPRVRLANQVNLMSAVRTALLLLPESFTERQLYETITSLSYMGDPRMSFGGENTSKVRNIVGNQLPNFRQLYVPLIDTLPNVDFADPGVPREPGWEREDVMARSADSRIPSQIIGGSAGFSMKQDMSPQRRGNMVRRLPKLFRQKLYYQYRKKFQIPGSAFDRIIDEAKGEDAGMFLGKREGGEFERRIAAEDDIREKVETCVKNTIAWPSTSQSVKGIFTAGIGRGWRYWSEKRRRYVESNQKTPASQDKGKDNRAQKKDGKEKAS